MPINKNFLLALKAPLLGALLVLCFSQSSLVYSQSLQSSQIDESAEVKAIRDVLTRTQAGIQIEAITVSPVQGLYEVTVKNGPFIYASADAKYFIPGDMYEAIPDGLVNLGQSRLNVTRQEKIAALDQSDMIIYPAKGESKATLTVFTDVDCQYCQKLHAEISQLNELGISIRYLAFPRSGLDEITYPKMVSTWCSDNRNVIFTTVIRGATISETQCDNPVAEHYQLGRELGVTGTPTLVFEDGSILPGYVPAETLASYLFDE